MAIKSNISNNFHTGCYHTPNSRLVSSIPSPWKAGRCWSIYRFRRRSSPEECNQAPVNFPAGSTATLIPRLQPSKQPGSEVPASHWNAGMWLVSTKERGPARIYLFRLHCSNPASRPLAITFRLQFRGFDGSLSCGRDRDKGSALRTWSQSCWGV